MLPTKFASVVLGVLLAGSLAACGGDDGDDGGGGGGGGATETVSAEEYANSVCTAMTDWLAGIQELSASIGETQTASPEEGKQALVQLLADMSEETGRLVTAVEEAGAPDVEGGEAVADQLVSAFGQTREALEEAEAKVEGLPTDQQGFQQGVAELGPTLQDALSGITDSLSEPESEELRKAFEDEPACSEIPV